ncbi:MAG: hypothetical protein V2A56_09100 [bacterium]
MKRILASLTLLLFAVTAHSGEPPATTLTLHPGPTYITFSQVAESASPDSIFGNQLPGAAAWAASTRILTANAEPASGSYYDTRQKSWRGTLKSLEVGAGYWIVLPPSMPPVTLTIPGIVSSAGIPQTRNGVLVTVEQGGSLVRPSEPPRSTAERMVVKEKPTTITASSGVYVQEGSVGVPATPGTPGDLPVAWVKIALDSLYSPPPGVHVPGAESAMIPMPLPSGGLVTVAPPPDFSIPPWGKGPVPE